jgi:hypothetical protein
MLAFLKGCDYADPFRAITAWQASFSDQVGIKSERGASATSRVKRPARSYHYLRFD